MSIFERYFKRPLDLVVAGLASLGFLPVALVVGLLIKAEDGGRVFYLQRRVGRSGQDFLIYKFRSMPENVGELPSRQAANLEVTRVGRVLRRFNIDELPQLINILKGEMSLVGPRPPLPVQKTLIKLRTKSGALECRPGLTGLAQVNGYDDMPISEKAQWDADYAANISFPGDLRIILRTFKYLFHPPPRY